MNMKLLWHKAYGTGKKFPTGNNPVLVIRQFSTNDHSVDVANYDPRWQNNSGWEHHGWHQGPLATPDVICWAEMDMSLELWESLKNRQLFEWPDIIISHYGLDAATIISDAVLLYKG